jgi:hypothetical protein
MKGSELSYLFTYMDNLILSRPGTMFFRLADCVMMLSVLRLCSIDDRMINECGSLCNENWRGKRKYLEKTCPSDKPESNHLSYSVATLPFKWWFKRYRFLRILNDSNLQTPVHTREGAEITFVWCYSKLFKWLFSYLVTYFNSFIPFLGIYLGYWALSICVFSVELTKIIN